MTPYSPEVKVRASTEAEFGYLAGIMDGEGYFSAASTTRVFGLRVAMTDESVILWLHQRFAGHISRAGKTTTYRQVYTWTLQRQADLLHVLPRLLPLLVCKRRQAEAMLAFVEHLRLRPTWDVPSARVSREVRARRRVVRDQWRERERQLRHAVPAAR